MDRFIRKYLSKIVAQNLAAADDVLMLARDADVHASRSGAVEEGMMREVLDAVHASTVLFARPVEPYRSIFEELTLHDDAGEVARIYPRDTETRTFLHDIPVVKEYSARALIDALSSRRTAIVSGVGIVTIGAMTPEQAFVMLSSTCFTAFVKYFSDALQRIRRGVMTGDELREFLRIWELAGQPIRSAGDGNLSNAAPGHIDEALVLMKEAGRAVVRAHLVDSSFGNISYVMNDVIAISRTGGSLDELEGDIDIVPLDGTSSSGITASSELPAHKNIWRETGLNAILHGHPRFAVIMSMDCTRTDCGPEQCYTACPEKRAIAGVPIVSGEIGSGTGTLMHTVPRVIREDRGVIVYGHGVFCAGRTNYRAAFSELQRIEYLCREAYRQVFTEYGIRLTSEVP